LAVGGWLKDSLQLLVGSWQLKAASFDGVNFINRTSLFTCSWL